ncbi:glycosyl hydrolase [Myxococcus llanfairpwllgwyngyllgogerychwyrndrobwllllantysiliogogogochensis]|uniref:Glycosyl hydrolase n=1 Tax=Myxococcus llanfairpwllgwyngyllgogerychwyrndrobwllllantysiliogogogochensis TaxID=2590453 RepID=A0A540X3R3_9BACT|nr:GH44 family glycoside hydrolase EpsB [Myxococcus llanfairpwllgwyngyllgogerychwyrndrobwllllantysiliogogogochensis]TQF15870.1 glycosyl hydrolase [Myxococcus llanfairpwllgwyngyllgogerychwyrndrobwllllantysiliogogogochensis]
MEDGVKGSRRKAGAAVLTCALVVGGTVAVAQGLQAQDGTGAEPVASASPKAAGKAKKASGTTAASGEAKSTAGASAEKASGEAKNASGTTETSGEVKNASGTTAASGATASSATLEALYDGGLGTGWKDIGWAPRELPRGAPARMRLFNYGGWILYRPKLEGSFGALSLRLSAPESYGEFLEVRLDAQGSTSFPRIPITSELQVRKDGEWSEILIPMELLNPRGEAFDRVVLRASKDVGRDWVLFDKVSLVPLPPEVAAALAAGGGRTGKGSGRETKLTIDCTSPGHRISPLIYGIAMDGLREKKDQHQYRMGATTRRWGGNPTSRYNWKLGGAWNTANDWFFQNVDIGLSYEDFIASNRKHGMMSAVTVPLIGWVAKDTTSVGFPVSKFGPQRGEDNGSGNGVTRDGTPLKPGAPSQTSTEASPEFVAEWVRTIRERDIARGGERNVRMYILDNEPMLWNSTHRDVFPEPLTYDGLLSRTIAYGTAVRKADPEALIAGPAEWGWTNYLWSAADFAPGKAPHSDRRAHGDVPLLPWYLRQLREHEKKTGVRILDVVDVHFYPQTNVGVGLEGNTDPETNARRIRSTRGLWDPTYKDESWIAEPVRLLPRLKEWIAQNYPGRSISIGEYNFGAFGHMSGGLAQAEALGRFAQENIYSAYFWQYPTNGSPVFWAFRAFRDFDGRGGHFQDYWVPAKAEEGTSVFASRDESGTKLVAVVLNFDPDQAAQARVELKGCGTLEGARVLGYSGAPGGFLEQTAGSKTAGTLTQRLPPYSMTVLDLTVKKP